MKKVLFALLSLSASALLGMKQNEQNSAPSILGYPIRKIYHQKTQRCILYEALLENQEEVIVAHFIGGPAKGSYSCRHETGNLRKPPVIVLPQCYKCFYEALRDLYETQEQNQNKLP